MRLSRGGRGWSAMPEVTGGAALLVAPCDAKAVASALRRIVDTPDLARDLSRHEISRAKELSWRRFAEANVALYRSIIADAVAPSMDRPTDAVHLSSHG